MRSFLLKTQKAAIMLISLMAFTVFTAQAQTTSGASVRTDKDDYIPGQTVIIEGDGWQPGEVVKLEIDHVSTTHPNTPSHGHIELFATANAAGHIYNNEFIVGIRSKSQGRCKGNLSESQ